MIGLAACGLLEPRAPEEIVKERAQARWDALVKGDIQAAYQFLSPASKSFWTLETYKAQLKLGFWKSAVVERVICSTSESCEAVAAIEYDFLGRRTKTPVKDAWIREGSNWWYVHR